MNKLLGFVEVETTGITKIFSVFSNHSGELLGEIHWRSGWRCYVMSYAENIDMSNSCMKELCSFIDNLDLEQKLNLWKRKKKKNRKKKI